MKSKEEIEAEIKTIGTYAVHACPKARAAALDLCAGSYQRDVVLGREPLSGAGIRNKWGGRYKQSREALMGRLKAARLAREVRGPHGRRVLVVGA